MDFNGWFIMEINIVKFPTNSAIHVSYRKELML
jgi:hypothetical protein